MESSATALGGSSWRWIESRAVASFAIDGPFEHDTRGGQGGMWVLLAPLELFGDDVGQRRELIQRVEKPGAFGVSAEKAITIACQAVGQLMRRRNEKGVCAAEQSRTSYTAPIQLCVASGLSIRRPP